MRNTHLTWDDLGTVQAIKVEKLKMFKNVQEKREINAISWASTQDDLGTVQANMVGK